MTSGSSRTASLAEIGVLDQILDQLREGRPPDVEALIAAHPAHAGDIRQLLHVLQFVHDAAAERDPHAGIDTRLHLARQPARLGDFRIVREIGRGGMGVVYEAVQESLDRRVALKVLLPGTGTVDRAAQRFMREARASGSLQHQHIVPVYAVGEHEGVPYYAMQYIEGTSLAVYIQQRRQQHAAPTPGDFRCIARWGQQAAEGLRYAHAHGVLHRDIKPANLLIDADNNLWIADFGLARTAAGVTITLSGDVLGTVRYMSPEQARGGRSVDERSDVYALGVTLFELACLRPPFGGPDRASTLKQVLMDTPPRPRHLNGHIPRPLEQIIERAMARDPAHRYPSAALMAEDLRRYLAGQPLLTRAPSRIRRGVRWVARHRVASAFALTVFVLLAGFGAAMAIQARRLASERDRARQAAQLAEEQSRRARVAAAATAQTAQFLKDMLAAAQPSGDGADVTVREVLDEAAALAGESLADVPEVEGTIRDTLAQSYRSLGLYPQAEAQFRAALEIRRSVLGDDDPATWNTMNSLGVLLQERGRSAEAEPLLRESFEAQRAALGADHPDTLKSMSNLGVLLFQLDRLDEALTLLREARALSIAALGEDSDEALSITNTLAAIHGKRGEYAAAEPLFARFLEAARRRFGPRHPTTLTALHNAARIAEHLDRLEEAETMMRQVVDLRRDVLGPMHPGTLSAINNLGMLKRRTGQFDEAEALLRDALAGRTEVLGPEHPHTLASCRNLALLLGDEQRPEEAAELFKRVLAAYRANLPPGHARIAQAASDLGDCLTQLGQFEHAETLLLEAYDALCDPQRGSDKLAAQAAARLAALYQRWGRPHEAARWQPP